MEYIIKIQLVTEKNILESLISKLKYVILKKIRLRIAIDKFIN